MFDLYKLRKLKHQSVLARLKKYIPLFWESYKFTLFCVKKDISTLIAAIKCPFLTFKRWGGSLGIVRLYPTERYFHMKLQNKPEKNLQQHLDKLF